MPQKTRRAFAEHGKVEVVLGCDLAILSTATAEGLDLETITRELEQEDAKAFCDPYEQLLSCIESKVGGISLRARR
jgi:hypothetical protein